MKSLYKFTGQFKLKEGEISIKFNLNEQQD
jgi:hypothetical protein